MRILHLNGKSERKGEREIQLARSRKGERERERERDPRERG